MNNKTKIIAVLVFTAPLLAGCLDMTPHNGPVVKGKMNIIAGGVGQDTPGRVYEEYGMDTTCSYRDGHDVNSHGAAALESCPDNNGFPHEGAVCGNMKWSVQFRNDHPTDNSEEKYGLPYDPRLVNSLQEWRSSHQELRFYWVRYSDTGCSFSDNEVIYCVELVSLSLQDSESGGCINAMHRTFPGLDTSWRQSLDYADPSSVADATSMAVTE